MEYKTWLDIDLRLFDGGAAAGGDGAGGITGETQQGPTAAGQGKETGGKEKQKVAPVAGEREGRRSGLQAVSPLRSLTDREDRRKRYQELINGEFKDFYTKDTQNIINRRFKETKILEERLGKSQSILDLLMERYGIADGDTEKLKGAIDKDNAYWIRAAKEAGMSVEQYKRLQRFRDENRERLDAQRQRRLQEKMEGQLQKWYKEGEELQKLYSGFDLAAEVREPRFRALLRSGIPVRHAYEVIHMDEIKARVAETAAKNMERQVVAGSRAKGVRPAENGTAAQSGFTVKGDVSKLTRKDRAEIARRAARGEKITF